MEVVEHVNDLDFYKYEFKTFKEKWHMFIATLNKILNPTYLQLWEFSIY